MDAVFTLDVYNNQDHPKAKVSLAHIGLEPKEKTTLKVDSFEGGGAMSSRTQMGADRKILTMTLTDVSVAGTLLSFEIELSVEQLQYAADRL